MKITGKDFGEYVLYGANVSVCEIHSVDQVMEEHIRLTYDSKEQKGKKRKTFCNKEVIKHYRI